VGKYEGPIFCHLWTKVHEVLRDCSFQCYSDCLYPESFWRYLPSKLLFNC